jgi:peptidoglycan/xylan/chitin deacetylase (PgdA/CDA1 family)
MPASAILTFHSIDGTGSVISFPRDGFARLLDSIAEAAIPVVPLAEVTSLPGSAAITFDDAFLNFHEEALPLLERHRFPATVFAVSGYCGANNGWPGQSSRVPVLPLMSWDHLRDAARRGITIGSHTVTHPDLSRLEPARAAAELDNSRRSLEDKLGRAVTEFAYPYGALPAGAAAAKHAGYTLAVTTELRYLHGGEDPHLLPRLDSYYLRGQPETSGELFAPARRHQFTARRLLREFRQALHV